MNITKYSRNRMMVSAAHWSVPGEYFNPLCNYLVHGYEPGSFWSAVLANDFWRAIQSSHPSNDIPNLKHAAGWIRDSWPRAAHGDHDTVILWQDLESGQRRRLLEQAALIYTEQEEVMMALTNVRTYEPIMY